MSEVKLIGRSVPAADTGMTTAEQLVAYVARVSNPNNQNNHETADRLLNYCLRKHHLSVFQTAYLTIEIRTSRAIGRQILRHTSFDFQEFSQRYQAVAMEPVYCELRMQDEKNRQNSIETEDQEMVQYWDDAQQAVWRYCVGIYRDALEAGVAKEVARAILPEGLTPSVMFMTGSLRSWITYCAVRAFGPGVQKEHKEIAEMVWEILEQEFSFLPALKPLVVRMGQELSDE